MHHDIDRRQFSRRPRAWLSREIQRHLERAELLIARLDRIDGDPDLENNGDAEYYGDEQDHGYAEDDFCDHQGGNGPGCPIADTGVGDHDGLHGLHDFRPIADPDAYAEQVRAAQETRTIARKGSWGLYGRDLRAFDPRPPFGRPAPYPWASA